MQMTFETEWAREWRGVVRLNVYRPVTYSSWLRFYAGLGNGGDK